MLDGDLDAFIEKSFKDNISKDLSNLEKTLIEKRQDNEKQTNKIELLKNKIIIITGGSQGIGRSMVEEFVKQKSKVHFLDIDKEGAKSLIKSLSSYNNLPTFHECDIKNIENEFYIDGKIINKNLIVKENFFEEFFEFQNHHHQEQYISDYKLKPLCSLKECSPKNHAKMKIYLEFHLKLNSQTQLQ